ncbi:hypothetical protein BsWGS_11746 [Bradybaena similaris]
MWLRELEVNHHTRKETDHFENKCLRQMTNTSWTDFKTNDKLREETRQDDVKNVIRKRCMLICYQEKMYAQMLSGKDVCPYVIRKSCMPRCYQEKMYAHMLSGKDVCPDVIMKSCMPICYQEKPLCIHRPRAQNVSRQNPTPELYVDPWRKSGRIRPRET